ncbi:unnamed protein product [Nesidiocoris tenuis]|uniref:Uncharacterized protein n=1 Tax=Nesidiocoris tenuis TaxID=355587 RepID=A0A6H5FVD4_9HEMI|nr:unnamed protein product [Nesidiocoris tenuis]
MEVLCVIYAPPVSYPFQLPVFQYNISVSFFTPARERHRFEADGVAPVEKADVHRSHGDGQFGRADLHGSTGGRTCPARRQRHHASALVVRAARQHDVQPQDQSALPLEEKCRADAAAQVLHEKGEFDKTAYR